MGYVTNNLMSHENVLHIGSIHWFIFVRGASLFAIGLATSFFAMPDYAPLATFFYAAGLVSSLKAFLFKISTEEAVTSKRVIAKTGFIKRNTIELNHQRVESLSVHQSIAGRIFGFGHISVNGTGGGRTPIPNISNPLEFRRKAMETIDTSQQSPQPVPPSPEALALFSTPSEQKQDESQQDWFAVGVKHLEAAEYTDAITALNKAAKTDLNNQDIYFTRADAFLKLADTSNFLEDIKTAARLGHPKAVAYLQQQAI